MKPQFSDQASLRIDRSRADSSSNRLLSTLRMRIRSFLSPDATIRSTIGAKPAAVGTS
jgi:hypothetical protein